MQKLNYTYPELHSIEVATELGFAFSTPIDDWENSGPDQGGAAE